MDLVSAQKSQRRIFRVCLVEVPPWLEIVDCNRNTVS